MAAARARTCPECRARFKVADDAKHLPFCSDRCKLIDLGRWLNGEFAIIEDLKRGQDLKLPADAVDDPDVKKALEELGE